VVIKFLFKLKLF